MTNNGKYTITVRGAHIAMTPARTSNRAHVNGFATHYAFVAFRAANSVLEVSAGGRVLSRYSNASGTWQRESGAEVVGLAGLDRADIYRLRYPLPHVTREYAEQMAAHL